MFHWGSAPPKRLKNRHTVSRIPTAELLHKADTVRAVRGIFKTKAGMRTHFHEGFLDHMDY